MIMQWIFSEIVSLAARGDYKELQELPKLKVFQPHNPTYKRMIKSRISGDTESRQENNDGGEGGGGEVALVLAEGYCVRITTMNIVEKQDGGWMKSRTELMRW